MTRCANCNEKWSNQTKVKHTMTLAREMRCPECGKAQYLSRKSQVRSATVHMVTMAVYILLPAFFDVGFTYLAAGFIIILVINLTYLLVSMTLANNDEVMDRLWKGK